MLTMIGRAITTAHVACDTPSRAARACAWTRERHSTSRIRMSSIERKAIRSNQPEFRVRPLFVPSRRVALVALSAALSAGTASAQQPDAEPAEPSEPAAPAAPEAAPLEAAPTTAEAAPEIAADAEALPDDASLEVDASESSGTVDEVVITVDRRAKDIQ